MFKQAEITFVHPYVSPEGEITSIGVQANIEDDEHGILPVSYQLAGEALLQYLEAENRNDTFTEWVKEQIKTSHALWSRELAEPAPASAIPDLHTIPVITQLS